MEEQRVTKNLTSISTESYSTSTSEGLQQCGQVVICPEDEKSNTLANKFIEELEKKKEKINTLNDREKRINIASNILFEKSGSTEPVELLKKDETNKFTPQNSFYTFCHSAVRLKDEYLRPPRRELSTTDFNQKYITSPFKLKKFIGYNPEVFVKNLSKALEFSILITTGNLILIYDYNSETHYELQGHRNRVVSTSIDAKGNWIASSDIGPDSSVIIWDLVKCFPIHVIWEFNKTGCQFVKLSPCAKYLVTVVEKINQQNIQMISLWEWVHGEECPDVSVEINTDEFGPVKTIDFCYEKCEFMIVTTEKRVIFLTFEKVSNKKILLFHYPTGLPKKNRKQIGLFNDSVFIRNSHMAITGTSTGQAVIWSDMPWNFFDKEPVRKACNKKNAFLYVQLDRYSIKQICSIDDQVVTLNSEGMIFFYNQRLQVLHVIKALKGCSPAVHISFHLKKRSVEGSTLLAGKVHKMKKGEFSTYVKTNKIADWEKLDKEINCWGKEEEMFYTRDFIATTTTGDIVYVNFSHNEVKFILRNQLKGVTCMDAHPERNVLCIGTDHGKLFLYDYTKNELVLCSDLPVVDAVSKELGAITEADMDIINCMNYTTYLKYDQSGHRVACGTKSGDVWILNDTDLDASVRIPRTTFPIVKIVFSKMNDYFAYYDSCAHLILMNNKNDTPYYIGKIRPHSKPIADIAFASKDNVYYLYSLGLDRYFVEYVVSECDRLGFIKINVYFRMELLGKGTCLYPDPSSRMTLLMFTEKGKCRFINLEKMHIYKTVQGPLLHNGVTFIKSLDLPNQAEYLLFVSHNEMGLLKCPVDGNPFKWVSHAAVSEEIEHVAIANHGKYVFCKGKNEYITMWEINTMPLNALEALGGKGGDPFATLLAADPCAPSLEDVQELFFYCQVAHRGRYPEKAYELSDVIGACDVPSAFRALGYFMTDYEEALLVDELIGDSSLNVTEVEVSFDRFIQTFVNHRVCRVSESAMKSAFCDLFKRIIPDSCTIGVEAPGVPMTDFLYFLENYGDKFDSCSTYIYLRTLIQPFTKQIEEELLKKIELAKEFPYIDSKYYDFMPEEFSGLPVLKRYAGQSILGGGEVI
ncbi:cilia- and flagella-associated protein 251 isoform X2 [Halyomorpha halys]|uniref:cilia- and flagella-associated protein 251 isoform X2 n=1 Tax=Halyomorpha halys TaxID=286706 RepID=UPI000D0C7554|nr:cilia- and flagella-associated protein 251 isoform X2 [Halyomorpha halys]